MGVDDSEPAALADGIVDPPPVCAEDNTVFCMDDGAVRRALRPHSRHHSGVIAIGYEADILAVGLGGNRKAHTPGNPPDFGLGHAAKRKAEEIKLRFGGRK